MVEFYHSILTVSLVFIISFIAQFPSIENPKKFTDLECKYIGKIHNYINNTEFTLSRPPLANMFYAYMARAKLESSDETYLCPKFNLLDRVVPATFSALTPPIISLTLMLYKDIPFVISFFCGCIISFEPSWCALNCLFSPNSFFYFFSILTIFFSILTNKLNDFKYQFAFKQIEAIVWAVSVCSEISGFITLFVIISLYIKYRNNKADKHSKNKELTVYDIWDRFQYHIVYGAVLYIFLISVHLAIISGESDIKPFIARLIDAAFRPFEMNNLRKLFNIKKLKKIKITEYIMISNNPVIVAILIFGVCLAFIFEEWPFSFGVILSLISSLLSKDQIVQRMPFTLIFGFLSLGCTLKMMPSLITKVLLISVFSYSLLFYVILFTKTFGGKFVFY